FQLIVSVLEVAACGLVAGLQVFDAILGATGAQVHDDRLTVRGECQDSRVGAARGSQEAVALDAALTDRIGATAAPAAPAHGGDVGLASAQHVRHAPQFAAA